MHPGVCRDAMLYKYMSSMSGESRHRLVEQYVHEKENIHACPDEHSMQSNRHSALPCCLMFVLRQSFRREHAGRVTCQLYSDDFHLAHISRRDSSKT
jgi:hypothetical protein